MTATTRTDAQLSVDGSPAVVAVIGLGAMGSRLAANLLADGYPVTVSSRRRPSAEALTAAGATWVATPAQAARSSDVVLVTVTDDDASRDVWATPGTGLLDGLGPGATAVECSTVSPGWVRQLAEITTGRDALFLEAPMVGSRPQVDARALVHLAGGDADVLARIEPVLRVSAARIHHCGAAGTAATTKLIVNALLAVQVASLAELLGAGQRAGLDPSATLELVASLPVTSPAAGRAGATMLSQRFAPNFPVDLVAKDLRYLTELEGTNDADPGASTPMTRAALHAFTAASQAGHGGEDLTSVARLHLRPAVVAGAGDRP